MEMKATALRSIRADGTALVEAARRAPDARIPSCPEWDMDALLDHVGRTHRWVSHIVGTRTQERWSFRNVEPGPEDRAARQRWVEQGVAELLDVLADVDEQEPVWNWAQGVAPAWFWLRRMGLETAVHRVDAQLGADNLAPVDTEMAVAGVDEHLAMLLPLMGERLLQLSTDSSLHVHCTDAEGEWLVRFTPEGPRVTREHAKGDTALRGAASDLYLFLWNRLPLDRCEVIGDDSLLRRWPDLVRI